MDVGGNGAAVGLYDPHTVDLIALALGAEGDAVIHRIAVDRNGTDRHQLYGP